MRAVAQLRSRRVRHLEWVDWFNHCRLLEPIGNIPPADAEAAYDARLEAMPIAAKDSSQPVSGKVGAAHPSGMKPASMPIDIEPSSDVWRSRVSNSGITLP